MVAAAQSVLALSGCLALRHLDLSHNQLTSVAGLEGAFIAICPIALVLTWGGSRSQCLTLV